MAYSLKMKSPESLEHVSMHYCPGCEHSLLTKIIASVIDEMGIRERTVMGVSVGCSVLAYKYLKCHHIQCPHGRAPAVLTGVKKSDPGLIAFTVQGDGDCVGIGMLETMYAAIRGEPITVFLYNNAIYGMTGGQMAPTTLQNQITTTTPEGRDVIETGQPVDMMKLIGATGNASYLKRIPIAIRPKDGKADVKSVYEVKKAVENAFKAQMKGGYAFVEFLGSCNVNWKKSVIDSKRFVHEEMVKQFPPGLYADKFSLEAK